MSLAVLYVLASVPVVQCRAEEATKQLIYALKLGTLLLPTDSTTSTKEGSSGSLEEGYLHKIINGSGRIAMGEKSKNAIFLARCYYY
jgi:hypothetical protein